MMMHLYYLKSQIRHKWFVFLECCKLGIFWLGIIHDLSKFLPSEWLGYARYFYGKYPAQNELRGDWRYCYTGLTKEDVEKQFDEAWLHHQHYNKHHFQYWYLIQDDDPDKPISIPLKYRKEMLADWRGAGIAYTGKDNTDTWYIAHRDRIKIWLHSDTLDWLDHQLGIDNN